MLLEICCYSPAAAVLAAKAGAHRIELCDNPGEGGTTPSYGALKWVRDNVDMPVFPIIRPRGGHFIYSDAEISIMADDIRLCKQFGYEGIVIGLLNENGQVAFAETARLVELAWPMEVTFHRAFDRVREPFEALEQITRAGCNRILTSGQSPTAPGGSNLIARLVNSADGNIIIMPGSGVRASNILKLAQETGAMEFHSSAAISVPEVWFSPDTMRESVIQTMPDGSEIHRMIAELESIPNIPQC